MNQNTAFEIFFPERRQFFLENSTELNIKVLCLPFEILNYGGNVAAVFASELPEFYNGFKVINSSSFSSVIISFE